MQSKWIELNKFQAAMRGKVENRDFVMKWTLQDGKIMTMAAMDLESFENWARNLK